MSEAAALSPAGAGRALERLRPRYGALPWRPHGDGVAELVLTILSQHTNDTLSGTAFARLLATFPTWDAIAEAPEEEIATAIKDGGLARQKAPRIKAALTRIREACGGYDLGFLRGLPVAEAKRWLCALPGVGPKTAACVLLFALGRPALPVDTHVFRVSRRLGLIGERVTEAKAHDALEALLPPEDFYAFHVALIKHGRHTCTAQRPRCGACPLSDICPSAVRGGGRPQPGG
ncbi:MAG: endonuclease III [Dehalococcoidia bacterium]